MIGIHATVGGLDKYSAVMRVLQDKGKGEMRGRVAAIVVDSLVGLLIFSFVRNSAEPSFLWPWVDERVDDLGNLITWLTQNPAGLKLNEPLNLFLAKFFKYHIYLWQTFMGVTRVLPLWCSLLSSLLLGFSLSIALLSDFLSLLTLHILCFEIYVDRYRMLLLLDWLLDTLVLWL